MCRVTVCGAHMLLFYGLLIVLRDYLSVHSTLSVVVIQVQDGCLGIKVPLPCLW